MRYKLKSEHNVFQSKINSYINGAFEEYKNINPKSMALGDININFSFNLYSK